MATGLEMDTRHRFNHRANGITITEVVVASALMLFSIVPILHALTSSQATARLIERKTRCLTLAQAKLDEIRTQAGADFDESFGQTSAAMDGAYLCTVADEALTNIRTVAVSVGYDDNGDAALASGEILVTLKTQIARR